MTYSEKLLRLNEIRERMSDDESKAIFDARIEYMVTRNADAYLEVTDRFSETWYCAELDKAVEQAKTDKIVIYGCGKYGIRTKELVEKCGYQVAYFIDSHVTMGAEGRELEHIRIVSLEWLMGTEEKYLCIIGSLKYLDEIYKTLLEKMYPKELILYPRVGILEATSGKQYFDVFAPSKDEIFVDAGAYDGETIKDFMTWTNGQYRKAYVIEPLERMCRLIERRIEREGWSNIVLSQNAAWNKKETLCFEDSGNASQVMHQGKSMIRGIDIDSLVGEDKVTYIKMDIEGSELQALEGAKNTIRKNKPKLAVCLYHKAGDVVDLPLKILEILPDYKFYIRHYMSDMNETVLYAVME